MSVVGISLGLQLEGQMLLGPRQGEDRPWGTLARLHPFSSWKNQGPEQGSSPAGVHVVLSHAPPKEALAAITA